MPYKIVVTGSGVRANTVEHAFRTLIATLDAAKSPPTDFNPIPFQRPTGALIHDRGELTASDARSTYGKTTHSIQRSKV